MKTEIKIMGEDAPSITMLIKSNRIYEQPLIDPDPKTGREKRRERRKKERKNRN